MITFMRLFNLAVWLLGLVLLFTIPLLGVPVLIAALVLSILTGISVREDRHKELIEATKSAAVTNEPPSSPNPAKDLSPEGRLGQLAKWREDGLITNDEYDQKRQEIIDEL
jgi:hypothetical protein